MKECDSNFNRIDSELRQVEEYINSLEAENAELQGMNSKLRPAWDRLCEIMFEAWEFDYSAFIAIGEETGLLISEPFEPEGKHKDMNVVDGEPGENTWFNTLAFASVELLANLSEEAE